MVQGIKSFGQIQWQWVYVPYPILNLFYLLFPNKNMTLHDAVSCSAKPVCFVL